MKYKTTFMCICACVALGVSSSRADSGLFDMSRWDAILSDVRTRAAAQNISTDTINATLKSPAFIPSIVRSDKNQSEFKLTLDGYLKRTVNDTRIANGRQMRMRYPTMLARVDAKYGVPPHVILAFWGMESNYGEYRAAHKLRDAFLTLMYDGRRETFFGKQLLALMKIVDDNHLDINDIYGSWAGAMGHFQFIPTTLAQYGVDGNGDGDINIIDSIGDAMFSAGNYLNRLGWNKQERIVRRVIVPVGVDTSIMDGGTKQDLSQWAAMGITNPDGTPLPAFEMTAGLVADVKNLSPDATVIDAYLTYPNFYRIKKWNNSNWYAIAIANLADELK